MWVLYSVFAFGAFIEFFKIGKAKPEPIIEEPEESSLESDWNEICQAAIEKAKSGDSSARTWVTKHIFEKKPEVIDNVKTDQSIIDEAITTLVKSMGYKRGEAKDLVLKVVTEKDFDTLDSLITHILKG